MTCGIYMIQNLVNGKMYIGKSLNIERRWGDHKNRLNGGYHHNEHLQGSWKNYGQENFEFSVLLECEESQLNTMEEYYITKLKTYDPDFGYNKTYGGGSERPTEESKRKLSESLRGRTLSEEHKKNLSENHANFKGENHPMFGKHHSEYAKKKMSDARKGKSLSEEQKKKLGKSHSKPIVQIDPTTNKIVNVWGSIIGAERLGGFSNSNITSCCKGKYKTHKGYKWQYLHEYISKIDPRIKKAILFDKEYYVN